MRPPVFLRMHTKRRSGFVSGFTGEQFALPEALDCLACRKRFAVEDGIPVLIVSEARPL